MRTMVETIAALLLMVWALSSCEAGQRSEAVSGSAAGALVRADSIRVAVYVVDSPWGRAYHRSRMCAGLKRATHEVVVIDSLEALALHFEACKICYPVPRKVSRKASRRQVPSLREPLTEPGGSEE